MIMVNYFDDKFKEIKDRLEEQIALLTDDTYEEIIFDEVKTGRKQKPTAYPSCIIIPGIITPRPVTVSKSEYAFRFDIRVIGKDNSTDDGLMDVIAWAGEIVQFLEDDRQFNHICKTIEIISINPDVERRRARTRHEVSIVVDFIPHLLPR